MANERSSPRHRTRGSIDAAIALVVNAGLLIIANLWPLWLPWTRGVLTEDFAHVLWALNIGFVLQIAGNLVLIAFHPRWLWSLADIVFALAGLLGVVVFYAVFPLDWGAVGVAWVDVLARIVLVIAMVGTSIAALVGLVRFVFVGGPVDHLDPLS